MSYDLNETETARLRAFRRHKCTRHTRPPVTVSFSETGIGTNVSVTCDCGKKRDLTDYASW